MSWQSSAKLARGMQPSAQSSPGNAFCVCARANLIAASTPSLPELAKNAFVNRPPARSQSFFPRVRLPAPPHGTGSSLGRCDPVRREARQLTARMVVPDVMNAVSRKEIWNAAGRHQ